MTKLKILTGAAIGTLLGSLAIALYPRRQEIMDAIADQSEGLSDKARDYIDALISKGAVLTHLREEEEDRSVYWKSGLAGVLFGAGAALFLAPKSGKQLRSQVLRVYNDLSGRTQEVIRDFKNNGHPFHHVETIRPVKRAVKRAVKPKS